MSLSICLSLLWDANQSTGTKLVNLIFFKFISKAILSSQTGADKLSLEMQEFGFPPVFPNENGEEKDDEEEIADPTKRAKKVGVSTSDFFVMTSLYDGWLLIVNVQVKSKVAAKGENAMYQWTIMRNMGMTDEEIKA